MANKVITEVDYPVSKWWIVKNTQSLMVIPFLFVFIVFSFLPTEIVEIGSPGPDGTVPDLGQRLIGVAFVATIWLIGTAMQAAWNYLRLKFFHYSVGAENLEIRSGVISRQERHMPYNRLQNVYVKQDLLDRLFRLSQVVVENAAGAGAPAMGYSSSDFSGFMSVSKGYDSLGNLGNSFSVPGLKPADAEALKQAILEKMKKVSSNRDGSSGL